MRDPWIQKVTAQNLKLILTKEYWFPSFYSALYRPFTTLTFLFNYSVLRNGANPVGYHVVNLLLHTGNAWLLFAIAWRILHRLGPAFFAAALWTAHPPPKRSPICVLQTKGARTKLNVSCPASNMCLTWADLAQSYFKARKPTEALFLKRTALDRGCPADLLDFATPAQ